MGKSKYTYLFSGAVFCFLISALCAEKKQLALWGGYQHFEGLFVLFGYLIVCMYTYYFVKDEESRILVLNGLAVTAFILCMIGFLQMAGKDPVFWEWVQKLIIPSSKEGVHLESRMRQRTVYLTLANANYASMYLSALIPVFWVWAKNQNAKKKVLLYILCAMLFVCMIFTYSRVGVLMLLTGAVFSVWFCRTQWRKNWKKYLLCFAGIALLFVVADGVTGFRFLERIQLTVQSFSQERKNCNLETLRTEQDGVHFSINGIDVRVYAEYGLEAEDSLRLVLENGMDISKKYQKETGAIAYKGLEDINLFIAEIEEEPMLILCGGKAVFRFAEDENYGWLLYTGSGKYDTIQPVQKMGFYGIEHMASGRFYIWSRTLPLLKQYVLFGCGADNFYLVYPQNDYLGKAQYCNAPLTIVEKPHNTYLLFAIQNGILSVGLFFVAYVFYLKEACKIYRGKKKYSRNEWIGIGIVIFSVMYMAGYMFCDSNINISPVFWVLMGMGERINGDNTCYFL